MCRVEISEQSDCIVEVSELSPKALNLRENKFCLVAYNINYNIIIYNIIIQIIKNKNFINM